MERGLIPNTTSWIQPCGELVRGLQGVARPSRGSRQSPENFLKGDFVFCFCKIWYFVSFCNYFGISSSLQLLQFGICIQFLQICFVFWSNRIILTRYLFSFCNLVFCFPLLLHSGSL